MNAVNAISRELTQHSDGARSGQRRCLLIYLSLELANKVSNVEAYYLMGFARIFCVQFYGTIVLHSGIFTC